MFRVASIAASAFLCASASGCFVFMNLDLTSEKTPYEEIVLEEADHGDDKVALIDLHGVLAKRYESSSLLSTAPPADPVSDTKEALKRAAADEDVKVVVLRIDSPGGVVAWCDAIYQEVQAFRKDTGKPVIAYVNGLGASGGYYVALAANKIYAAPTAAIGSIGVIALFLNLEKLAGKIGVETQVIKSGPRKDMGGLWRPLDEDEKKIMQAMIDEYYGRFFDLVLANRPNLTAEKLRPIADGRLLTAHQAHEGGLVDELLYIDEAIARAKREAGVEHASVVTYARSHQYRNNFYSQAPAINVVNVNLLETATLPAGFYFLWQE